jgi:S-adenosylmethionine:tRNA ribosyltransferase-isomerase
VKLSDFDYSIPENLIAQHPLTQRDVSRLLVLNRMEHTVEHRIFSDITEYLHPGDVLVLNDTKVIPVRLFGKKPTGGKAEITLLHELGKNNWEALVKGMKEGTILLEDRIAAKVTRRSETICEVEFIMDSETSSNQTNIRDHLKEIGNMPLPVYIKRKAAKSDLNKYQTVYAKKEGAVAAPTAGLHFTDKLLNNIRNLGVEIKTITLHVGYGTFRPVKVTNIEDHQMDEELLEIPEETAISVNAAKAKGRRVIAVGTTVTRTLEAFTDNKTGRLIPGTGKAGIFIYPGYSFKIVDMLLTNFHMPSSTPMMLASAFSGLELLKKSYKTAISEKYRFFSFGDAMLIT